MPEKNVQIIRRLVATYNESGFGAQATLAFFAESAVFEEPPEQPGATVVEGRDQVARTFGQFDEVWEEHRSNVEEVRVIDAERVLLLTVENFRGQEGMKVSQPSGWSSHSGRQGRANAGLLEPESALKAAGLSE